MADADAPAMCPDGHVGARRLLPVFATTGRATEPAGWRRAARPSPAAAAPAAPAAEAARHVTQLDGRLPGPPGVRVHRAPGHQ